MRFFFNCTSPFLYCAWSGVQVRASANGSRSKRLKAVIGYRDTSIDHNTVGGVWSGFRLDLALADLGFGPHRKVIFGWVLRRTGAQVENGELVGGDRNKASDSVKLTILPLL